VFLAGYPLFSERSLLPPRGSLDLHLHEVLIASSMILAAIFVARTDSRLAAVVGLGIMGIGTALQFLILGGPDLAMTQLAVETLSVLLFVYVLFQMPRFDQTTSRAIRIRDLLLSLVVGTFFTGLLWTIDTQGSASQLSQYFAEYSLSEGRGRNVVNVILVDFRALDTMGEICVLTVAALGVFGLLRFGRPPREVA
jgi:multicomponent Na+:H+ antiporter subunit A